MYLSNKRALLFYYYYSHIFHWYGDYQLGKDFDILLLYAGSAPFQYDIFSLAICHIVALSTTCWLKFLVSMTSSYIPVINLLVSSKWLSSFNQKFYTALSTYQWLRFWTSFPWSYFRNKECLIYWNVLMLRFNSICVFFRFKEVRFSNLWSRDPDLLE